MERYHPMGALAPRDVVARAIDAEMKRTGDDCVYLDMTHLGRAFLVERFPNIYATCKAFGIDMAVQPIPVVPAAHYMCGGVVTDLHGRTTLPGPVRHRRGGLHRAARRQPAGVQLAARGPGVRPPRGAAPRPRRLRRRGRAPQDAARVGPGQRRWTPTRACVVTHNWDEIRRLMWNYVGIVRTDKRLMRARRRLDLLREEIRDYYWRFKVTRDVIELRNIADVALADRRVRQPPQGEPRPALHPRLPRHATITTGTRDTVVSREL